jgi:hypothetical protein
MNKEHNERVAKAQEWIDEHVYPMDDFAATVAAYGEEIERQVYQKIYEKRREKRACNPERAKGECDCPICRWSKRVEDIKAKLSAEDADVIEDMGWAISDAETEAEMIRFNTSASEERRRILEWLDGTMQNITRGVTWQRDPPLVTAVLLDVKRYVEKGKR